MGVRIRNLTKTYGDVVALDSLDLDVKTGELLVLLGPSGCGKTTTMRSIAGLETPNSGEIRIDDEVVFSQQGRVNVRPNQRDTGLVFQSYAIWPHMTVFDNVAFPLKMKRVRRSELRERVMDVLETVGLENYHERGASALSGGQMQRVALARSLVMQPGVLLLDEPLSNLDARLRDKLRFELRAIQQRYDLTSVYVTHDQSEALALADQIAVMQNGKVAQLGGPEEIYRNPASRYVAEFLGVENLQGSQVVEADGSMARVRLADADVTLAGKIGPQAANDIRPGNQVTTCIRAEDIEIEPASDHDPDAGEENVVHGTVEVASFLGDKVAYLVRDGRSAPFYVNVAPVRDVVAPGTAVRLRIPVDRVQVLQS